MAQARNRAFAGALIPLLTFATFALLCPACSVTVGQQNPHPNVALSPQERGVRLALGSDIQERLAPRVWASASSELGSLEIERWHETLIAGFQNAFGREEGAPAKGEDDSVLTLDQTLVEVGPFDLARARIQYKATLTKRGVLLQRFAGTAIKKGAPASTQWGDVIGADVTGAVEAMYEQIAKELADGAPAPAAAEPPRCVPGKSVGCVGPKGCQGFQVCANGGTFGACSCAS